MPKPMLQITLLVVIGLNGLAQDGLAQDNLAVARAREADNLRITLIQQASEASICVFTADGKGGGIGGRGDAGWLCLDELPRCKALRHVHALLNARRKTLRCGTDWNRPNR